MVGVDAYPVPFMRQKFLYLWNRGIHPEFVIVGYSFNEGGLGHLVDSDPKTKDQFAAAVRFKNHVRSIALYDLIVENWARSSYNRMKKYMVPGTNFRTLSQEDVDLRYTKSLQSFHDDLESRQVKPIFLLFTGFDARTNQYDTKGPFQLKFDQFAVQHQVPLLRTNQALASSQAAELPKYFIDQCHMNETGTQKVGQQLANFLSPCWEARARVQAIWLPTRIKSRILS